MTEATPPDPAHPEHTHDAARLGVPRLHLRSCDSTNERARALAMAGAPHGTLVSADEQTAGRGRQGRSWVAPPGECLLCSLVLRWTDSPHPPALLPLIAGVAACEAIGDDALVKWPNDIVFAQPGADDPPAGGGAAAKLAKVAGVLVESRPQEGWAVLGVGVNVALRLEDLPAEVRVRAATLGRTKAAIEPLLADLLAALSARLDDPPSRTLEAWRARDALAGREVAWAHGRGRAEGVDAEGRLLVRGDDGETTALSAGDVHLSSAG
ncbi:MAG TPA: biotin--[acetyl-CoA-carboxylase] ligase [Solirubrobacteraceae bacterium]|jgi:BirA family biotin operon repressor/biotin-[acetyl-CoA-carboxylase] ligase|nr:biotin--[acetyl-CoA-carboxylase] ligase [Solirubrobacteraceae bacterium]